jgi:glycosyltransferase involved in cell wall biosynthesis
MDADLQHPIDIVDQFLDGWINEGADVVYAYQPKEQRDGWLNRMLSKAYYKIINTMAEVSVPPNAGDFRLLSKRAYSALRELGERQRMMKGLYSWIGFQQKGIAFTSRPRLFGKTKFSPLRLSVLAIDGITSFSTLPLRLTVLAGILLALLAGGYGVWIIIQIFVYGADVPGFATLIVAITSIGAAQLIFLGIIGEYIGKILLEVKRRPLFIVESDERLGGNLLTPAGRTRVEEHIS